MSQLYPLLMQPAFDPRPWGSQDLAPIYPNHRFEQKIGEAWLTGDACKVANGPWSGRSLAELSSMFGRELVGDSAPEANRFPLLVKFLFPHEKLSVQVHPDDEAARRVGQPWGKTECWYIAHAKPGAQIALGLKAGATRGQFERAVHERRAEDLLNWINVFPGEMIYVAGGTVHTLGPGSVIVETQQQSDTTYRLYDYGRPRELHLQQGLAAVKEKVASGKVLRPAPVEINGGQNRRAPLIAAPYFVVEMFELNQPQEFFTAEDGGKNSVQILVAVEGCGIIEAAGGPPVTMAKGDAVAVPASLGEFRVRAQWRVEFLKARVPGARLPEPEVRL
ncbi:MAG TPA: type I phosphomannose isomerase catalytic subunit [Terriglobales bacterium]|nr:type I phosphomannose isomerase catalytic subunit [Terriglobales bacterium]